jgi:hypothetical protein
MKTYQTIKNYFPIIVWPMLVLAIHLLCMQLGAYRHIYWLDTPMHFFGGASIAASSYYLFKHLENKKEFSAIPIVKVLFAIAITGLIAVLWEFSEYGQDLLFHTVMQPSIFDTMKDLAMGLLGATVFGLIKYRK